MAQMRPRRAPRRFRAAQLVVLLALAIVCGRLAGIVAPLAASLAPVVCSICHGCAIHGDDEPGDHAVCDCTACRDVAAGKASGAPSVHDLDHGGAPSEATYDGGAALTPSVVVVLPPSSALLPIPVASALASAGPRPPPSPPPRA